MLTVQSAAFGRLPQPVVIHQRHLPAAWGCRDCGFSTHQKALLCEDQKLHVVDFSWIDSVGLIPFQLFVVFQSVGRRPPKAKQHILKRGVFFVIWTSQALIDSLQKKKVS